MRRAGLRALALMAVALALAGCAGLASTGPQYDRSTLAEHPTLLVATTRRPVNGARAKPWFGTERATLSLARARLSPPDSGRMSLAAVGLVDWRLDKVEPVPGDVGALLAPTQNPRDVLIYVHGFKQTFESAALDAARLSDGVRFSGDTMVFSWPSRAGLFDYLSDRDSAMLSRDALERVIYGLMASPSVGRVHLIAHSMGSMLTLETLRQLETRYGDSVADKIGAIVFASPDLDMDVLTSSVERLGPLARKMIFVTATNDRALALSTSLAGGITRVGAAEKATLERLGLRVVDASQQGWGLINHDLFLSNAEVRKVVRDAMDGRPVRGASAM